MINSNPNFYTVGGTVQASGGLYIEREADQKLLALCQAGTFAYVLTARQLGKSSLMVATANKLTKTGTSYAIVDLSRLGTQYDDIEWYLGIIEIIDDDLELMTDIREWWQKRAHLSATQRFVSFFQEVVMKEITTPVVIFLDEIDSTLSLRFTDDFFAAIRALYNARAHVKTLHRLTFVLIGVATPSDLINDPKRTPFNIGLRVDLTDFDAKEAKPLAKGFGLPSNEAEELLASVLAWTSGHPYLTQRLCLAVAQEERSCSDAAMRRLVESIFLGEQSEEDSNLKFVRDMLTKRELIPEELSVEEVLSTYRDIRLGRRAVRDEVQSRVKSHLKLSGIVVREKGNVLRVRNRIYEEVFDREWIEKEWPLILTVGGSVQANPGGTYLKRPADKQLLAACLANQFSYVLACRQIGKSSLMFATRERLLDEGCRVAVIDLNRIGQDGIRESEEWSLNFLCELSSRLELSTDVKAWWDAQADFETLTRRFLQFLYQVVLSETSKPVVIFIDYIDTIFFEFPFSDDFFAAIRAVYDERAQNSDYQRLTFVLLGVVPPDELIKDHHRTPFNIGLPILIRDFELKECEPLRLAISAKHSVSSSETYFQQIYDWTSGHPYLTQKLCAAVAEAEPRPDLVENQVRTIFLSDKEDKEDDNLRFVQSRVLNDPHRRQMLYAYQKILQDQTVPDDEQSIPLNRLKLYGLVVADEGKLKVRNKIYQEVFDLAWIKVHTQVDWTRHAIIGLLMVVTLIFGFNLWQQAQITDEERALTYERNFENATDPNERMENLAGLFDLEGYDDQAREKFDSLLSSEQIALFANATTEMEPQVITVIEGTYTYLSNTEPNNRVLQQMQEAADGLSEEHKPLANQIKSWLKGREYFVQGNYQSAHNHYGVAIGYNPSNPAIYFDRALAKVASEEHEHALGDFETLLEWDDGYWQEQVQEAVESDDQLIALFIPKQEAYPILSVLLVINCDEFKRMGDTLEQQAEYAQAYPKLELALLCYQHTLKGDRSKEGHTLLSYGRVYEVETRYDKALAAYQKALTIWQDMQGKHHEQVTTLLNVGRVYEAKQHYEEALESYQQALTISLKRKAENATVHVGIGRVYEVLERYDEALEAYQQAADIYQAQKNDAELLKVDQRIQAIQQKIGDQEGTTLHPSQEPTALVEIGDRLLLESDIASAEEAYNAALAADPDYALAYAHRCYLRTLQRQVEEAIADCQQAITLAPLEAEGYIYLTRAYDWANEFEKAVEAGEQAIALAPDSGLAHSFLGEAYLDLGQLAAGEREVRLGVELAPESAEVHRNLAYFYQLTGDVESQLSQLEKAVQLAPNSVSYLEQIASLYEKLAQDSKALDYYQQALLIYQEAGNRLGEENILNRIGSSYYAVGRYSDALDYFQQALVIQREIGDPAGEDVILNNIGPVYQAQGRYEAALETYQQALEIQRKVGAGEGHTLNNIGIVYENQGKYDQALAFFQQALEISREVGDRAGEGIILNNIGLVYDNQGKYDQALAFFLQALEISREVGNRAGEGTTANNIGRVYDNQGKYDQALEQYIRALEISREVGDRAGEGRTLDNIGLVYHHQGKYDQALEQYIRALEISREIGNRAGEGRTLDNIGLVYHHQGKYVEALEQYQQALEIRREVGDRVGEGRTLDKIGFVYEQQGQAEEALVYYEQALDIFEALRATAGGEEERTSFMAQYADLYDRAIGLYHQQGQNEEAFLTSERGRARSFLDSLATGYVQLSDDDLQALIDQERKAYDERFAIRDGLARARAQNPPDAELVADLEAQLEAVEEEYSKVQAHIEAQGDELAALVPGRSGVSTLAEIQALLDEETTLLSYWVLGEENGTLAFVITADELTVVELPEATPEKLRTQVTNLHEWFNTDNAHPKPLRELHRWLVAPLVSELETPKVGIIGHQQLHYVSFAALTGGQGESYFGEQFTIFTLPSASVLRFINQNVQNLSPTTKDAFIFANPATDHPRFRNVPLAYAANEAANVAELFDKASVYMDSEASEARLRSEVEGAGVVHLAAHGIYSSTNPLENSFIALAPGGGQDGRLAVSEVYGLDLSAAEMVVLSSCQTNVGDVSRGDDIMGLTRAFFFAGTPTLVSGLWNVDDVATEELMTAFYRNWQTGMGKAEALQAAQAELRTNPRWASPYYWAGFVVNGDPGQVSQPPKEAPAPTDMAPPEVVSSAKGGSGSAWCLIGVFFVIFMIFMKRAAKTMSQNSSQ